MVFERMRTKNVNMSTADRWQRSSLNRRREGNAAVIGLNINGTRKMVIGVCVRCALKILPPRLCVSAVCMPFGVAPLACSGMRGYVFVWRNV